MIRVGRLSTLGPRAAAGLADFMSLACRSSKRWPISESVSASVATGALYSIAFSQGLGDRRMTAYGATSSPERRSARTRVRLSGRSLAKGRFVDERTVRGERAIVQPEMALRISA
jgi:hypothetical protein